MEKDDQDRKKVTELLKNGLQTEVEPRAYSSEEVQAIISRLQALVPEQLQEKIQIAGFTLTPYTSPDQDDDLVQSCETCMYFVIHRRFCELPELNLPVEKEWSCRLWRI